MRLGKKTGRAFYTGTNPLQPLTFECFAKTFETARWRSPFTPLSLERPDLDIRFVCEHEAEEHMIRKELPKIAHPHFIKGYLSGGFGLVDSTLTIVPITELTHRQKVRREKWRSTYHTPPSDFHELIPGDLVVHFNHGIGKYQGMEKRPNHQGVITEYLLLEYSDNSKLFVPVSQAYLVSRYIGTKEETPVLHTLGTKNWQRAKASAQKAIVGYAQDLLRMNAEREVHGGFLYPQDSSDFLQFEEEFPYPETEDQLRAIFDIKTRHGLSKSDGPAALRRCRLRKNRSRHAGCI